MTQAEAHYVAALEVLEPADAVRLAGQADAVGFAGTVIADRFQPWLPSQGNASFCWAVAGAIAQQVRGQITVSAVPGYRMHPVSIAHASATTAALARGGHRLVLSAGDAIDEHVVGGYWPEAPERAARLFESGEVIRKLFGASSKGNDVRHVGESVRMESARLWTMPDSPPSISVWAGGPVTARRAGRSGFGLVTQATDRTRLEATLTAYREGAREAGSAGHALVHAQLSWAPTDTQAMDQALREWPMVGLRFPRGDIRSPFDVAQLARSVTADDIRSRIPVAADPGVHRAHLQSLLDLGFDGVQVHNVGGDQAEWIQAWAHDISPTLAR